MPLVSTLFPYTTLFRSQLAPGEGSSNASQVRADLTALAVDDMASDTLCCFILMKENASRFYSPAVERSEEHTSELQSRGHLVCRLLLEKKNIKKGGLYR